MLLLLVASASLGCSELRGRRRIQQANQLFRDGQYAEAVAMFREAAQDVPDNPVLWLNLGHTCHQMLIPGAKTTENDAAVKCALDAFDRLQKLSPQDPRGLALYVQTLFEADQYETLVRMYEVRFRKDPHDEEAVNGLVQVYQKWPNHLNDAIKWYKTKADLKRTDAESQYAVGVFIWQQLFAHGGGADKAEFVPGSESDSSKRRPPPGWNPDDIRDAERLNLSDVGLKYLERAVELRPKYHEAMAYVNLLYRQKSFAYLDKPDEWQKCIDKSTEWRNKMLEVMGKPAAASAPTAAPEASPGDEKPATHEKPRKSKRKKKE